MNEEVRIKADRCPVEFDHESVDHAYNWPERYRALRAECPVAWTESHGGYWVATRYKDVISLAQNNEVFTSGKSYDPETGEVVGGIVIPPLPAPGAIPDETDNPEWEGYRKLLNRNFGPKAIENYRESAQQFATYLIDQVIETGQIDIVNDFTSPLPAMVTMKLVGFPLDEARRFADLMHEMIYTPKGDPGFAHIMSETQWIRKRVAEGMELYRREPADNLLSYLVQGKINDKYLEDEEIQQIIWNVLAGGVDTTTGLTANVLLHLYEHPDKRQQLIDHPEIIPLAREEFVRYFSPIHALSRTAQEDTIVDDRMVLQGERILLAYAAANRDPEIFEDPDEVKLDRYPNRHIGFGAGMHRCIGSFFARMMFETMLNEVLTRLPDYEVDVARARKYTSISAVNGWIDMPATFTPGPKSGKHFSF